MPNEKKSELARFIPQQCPEKQNSSDHLFGQWCKTARRYYVVRQFLFVASSRVPIAVGLQACDFDDYARRANSVV